MSFASTLTAGSFPIEKIPMSTASGNVMRKSGSDLRKFSQIDARTLAERACQFLRDLYPAKTAMYVSADIGVAVGTVRKWLDQGHCPSGPAYDAMIATYGAGFLCAIRPDEAGWWHRVARAERQALLEARARDLEEQLADLRSGV
ncbi:hypothetical protein [Methylobacterium tarhaniae]|uniref:hypothetical protein n=1 Tax=Methylobacterium tarhaniae TaxID=1187852 RepID=UPI000AA2C2AE|nr:hypothetical protein [Methylobacterium tarhaniae]